MSVMRLSPELPGETEAMLQETTRKIQWWLRLSDWILRHQSSYMSVFGFFFFFFSGSFFI